MANLHSLTSSHIQIPSTLVSKQHDAYSMPSIGLSSFQAPDLPSESNCFIVCCICWRSSSRWIIRSTQKPPTCTDQFSKSAQLKGKFKQRFQVEVNNWFWNFLRETMWSKTSLFQEGCSKVPANFIKRNRYSEGKWIKWQSPSLAQSIAIGSWTNDNVETLRSTPCCWSLRCELKKSCARNLPQAPPSTWFF